jgi:polyphenol oxidase
MDAGGHTWAQPGAAGAFFGRALGCARCAGVRARAAAALGCDGVQTARQVHGARCLTVTDAGQDTGSQEADALATALPGVALGVVSADCAPVLLAGLDAGGRAVAVAAAHAGWRGALAGVLEAAVRALANLGAGQVRAAVGPCIGPASYAVSPGFEAPFLEHDARAARFFAHGRFDLPGYAAWRLARAGARVDTSAARDTYAAPGLYFSHRRDGPPAGRNLALIALR